MKKVCKTTIRRQGVFIPLWLGFVMLFSATSAAGQLPADSLWEKASHIVNTNKLLQPHRIVISEVTKNKSGETEEAFKLVLRKNSNKRIKWEPVLLNDLPVSREDEKHLQIETDELIKNLAHLHPFTTDPKDKKPVKQEAEKQYEGINAIVYSLREKKDDRNLKGEILIDSKTAVPLLMKLSYPDSFKEEGVTVSDYTLIVKYSKDALNWHPVSLSESMTLKATTFPFLTWVGTHVSKVVFEEFKTVKSGE